MKNMSLSNRKSLIKELVIISVIGIIVMILIPILLKNLKLYIYFIFEGIALLAWISLCVIDYIYRKRK